MVNCLIQVLQFVSFEITKTMHVLEPIAFRQRRHSGQRQTTHKREPRWSSELNVGFQGGDARQLLVIAGQLEAIACWILQAPSSGVIHWIQGSQSSVGNTTGRHSVISSIACSSSGELATSARLSVYIGAPQKTSPILGPRPEKSRVFKRLSTKID